MEDLKHATENYHVGSSEFTQGVKESQDVTSCRRAYEAEMMCLWVKNKEHYRENTWIFSEF